MFQIERGQPVNGKNKSHNRIDVIQDIDLVPANVQSASREAFFFKCLKTMRL